MSAIKELDERALDGLRAANKFLTYELENKKNPIKFQEVVFNLKEWEKGRDILLENFLRASRSKIIRSIPRMIPIVEPLGTLEGAGCAVINTLKSASIVKPRGKKDKPSVNLGLLIAGEGSRLWGISATLAFVKGLSNVLGFSLVEQTIHQAMLLAAQAPKRGEDMIILAGTDNVFLPSQPLTTGGMPFAKSKANLFCFSKEVQVLDASGNVISQESLQGLTQLGIMLVDDKGAPILFLEKVSTDAILQVLKESGKKSVYFNTFYFAMTRKGANKLVELYSKQGSTGHRIYQMKGFDWSAHVLEPLACPSRDQWDKRHAASMKMFPNKTDWDLLWENAQEFKRDCGSPAIVNIGADSIWYDTGLANDLVQLTQLAVSGGSYQPLMRELFNLPKDNNVVNSQVRNVTLPAGGAPFLLFNANFKNGGSVGPGAVVVNSVFEQETHIPPNTIVVNSKIHSFDSQSETNALVYGYADASSPVKLQSKSAHFSAFIRDDAGRVKTESGVFPLNVVPKDKGKDTLLNYYNTADNAGKSYLEQTFLGFSAPTSFRQLQEGKRVSLKETLALATSLNNPIPMSKL